MLTKADLVDPDILDLVRLEVDEFVRGSFLEQRSCDSSQFDHRSRVAGVEGGTNPAGNQSS